MVFVLFAAGFIVALGAASMLRRTRRRLLLAGGALALWAAYAVYVEMIYACPRVGECDKGIGVIFVGAAALGWLAGVAVSWVVRRPAPR
jgi:hypothetical protein